MAQKDTVERILDAAEILFSERGFAETSLRTITSAAGVNLAAVNYHFGSKKALIQAVFVRFMDPVAEALNVQLDAFDGMGRAVQLPTLLARLADAILNAHDDPVRTVNFMRLLGLAYTQAQGHLQNYFKERYHRINSRFFAHLQRASNGRSEEDLFWGLHFALGSVVFTFSSHDSLRAIREKDTGQAVELRDTLQRLIPFIAAGILAS
ncbi:Transcriptional regulator [gamma proteobacterium HdN1]|nr:Transcriptional regulator [gamma proteobacterium HdN1]